MKLLILTWTLLLISSIFSIHAHPSKPLNERSTELAWQAWLLVDEHQNKQDGDGLLRRRITPKSIFITPTFSPDKLQPCADGYESDNMGRCMKIIKIDEDAHLDFLLQKLNAQFGVGMIVDVDEKLPTPGPIKFEISLGNGGGPDTTEQVTEEPNGSGNVAIVVAPSNSKHSTTTQEITSTGLQEEGTTNLGDSTITTTVENEPTITSTRFAQDTTQTDSTTTVDVSTESQDENTEPQALFFRDPSSKTTLKPQQSTYDDVIVIGNRMREPESTTYLENDSTITNTNTEAVRFDFSESKPVQGNLVKFPPLYSSSSTTFSPPNRQIYPTTPQPSPSTSYELSDRVRDFEQLFSAYVNTRAGDLTANERLIFNRTESRQPPIPHHRVYNHRNRDKHHVAWQFPAPAEHYNSRRRGEGGLDVRYTRERQYPPPRVGEIGDATTHAQQRRTSTDRYYRPGGETPAVYREVPRKDLSHIFGFKRALNNR